MTQAGKSQSDKFKEAARELGADQDESAFDRALRAIAKRKPAEKKGDDPKS